MTAPASSHGAGEDLVAQRRRTEICVRFEKSWRTRNRPQIEAVCLDVPEVERLALIHELVGLELDLRLRAGERPTLEEYCRRFPELASSIPLLFEEVAGPYSSEGPPIKAAPGGNSGPRPDLRFDLLLGLLAFQNNFIDRDALLAAFNTWIGDKSQPLGRVLLERGILDRNRHALLEALVQEHLKENDDDPEKSLAVLSSIGDLRKDLEGVADSELNATLAQVSADHREPEEGDTASWVGSLKLRGDRFRIIREFDATGALGKLFVAHDLELHRQVILKQIRDDRADNDETRGRFLLEAEITGNLEHPGIVPVYGLGKYANNRPFYAMRRIQGRTLAGSIREFHDSSRIKGDSGRQSLAIRKLLRHFVDVCNTIDYAHSRGILHRDLKPANIMLGDYGETFVIDWGLAKPVGHRFETSSVPVAETLQPSSASTTPETVAGSIMGTPQFMSPEQADGQHHRLGPTSDVYSLGATLYVLLTGQAPYRGPVREVLENIRQGRMTPPRQINANVPRALDAVCLKAMALRPKDRYASAGELALDIERWLADEPVTARRGSLGERLTRWARHHKPLVSTSFVLALIIPASLAGLAIIRGQRDAAEARKAKAETEKTIAEQNARSAVRLQLVDRYFKLITPFNEVERSKPGWTWRRMANLREATSLNIPERDSARLRSEVADCLAAFDVALEDPGIQKLLASLPSRISAFDPDPDPWSRLVFSPDGRFLALGQGRTTFPYGLRVRVVDLVRASEQTFDAPFEEGGEQKGILGKVGAILRGDKNAQRKELHEGTQGIVFSPDGSGIMIGTQGGWIHHWDLSKTDPRRTSWQAHDNSITALAVSSDPRWLFSSSADGTVKRWDLGTLGPGRKAAVETGKLDSRVALLQVTLDGSLACLIGGRVSLLDATTMKPLASHFDRGLAQLAMGPDGRLLAASFPAGAGVRGCKVVLLNIERDEDVLILQDPALSLGVTHEQSDLDFAFSLDGALLASASTMDRELLAKVWEVATGRLLARIPVLGGSIQDIVFSPDGRRLAVATKSGAALYELAENSFQTSIAHQAHPVAAIDLDSNGTILACASEPRAQTGHLSDSEITLWNTSTRHRTYRRPMPPTPDPGSDNFCSNLMLLNDSSAIVSSWTWNRIIVTPIPELGEAKKVPIESTDSADLVPISLSSDGATLWAAVGTTVQNWSVDGWAPHLPWTNKSIRGGPLGIRCIATGRKWAVAGGRDGIVRLFSSTGGPNLVKSFPASNGPLSQVALSPDERMVAAGAQNGTLSLFEVSGGREVFRKAVHADAIQAIAFSPDGRLMVTGSKDRTIRITSASDGFASEVLTLRSPTAAFIAATFSPDGDLLYTANLGETAVRVWNLKQLRERLKPMGLDWN